MTDILTQADHDAIAAAQRSLLDLIPVIQRAEACGIDCQQYKAKAEAYMMRLKAMVDNFPVKSPQYGGTL